jgi:hypothetical protein
LYEVSKRAKLVEAKVRRMVEGDGRDREIESY